ncbi:hypothetical protein MRX96_037869 [Rhipicephalus microplus]
MSSCVKRPESLACLRDTHTHWAHVQNRRLFCATNTRARRRGVVRIKGGGHHVLSTSSVSGSAPSCRNAATDANKSRNAAMWSAVSRRWKARKRTLPATLIPLTIRSAMTEGGRSRDRTIVLRCHRHAGVACRRRRQIGLPPN